MTVSCSGQTDVTSGHCRQARTCAHARHTLLALHLLGDQMMMMELNLDTMYVTASVLLFVFYLVQMYCFIILIKVRITKINMVEFRIFSTLSIRN